MKKGIQIGLIWAVALLLLFPIGNVMATDIGSDSDTGTTIRCHVNAGTPVINSVQLLDSTDTEVSNTTIDVLQTYHFVINVTQPGGWANISYVNATLWYDFGADPRYPAVPPSTNNTQFRLNYTNTTGTATFDLYNAGSGEVTVVSWSESVYDNTTMILTIYFTLNEQIRHAPGPGVTWTGGQGLNDAYTWNYRINATNNDGVVSNPWEAEFGVFKYTNVTAVNDPEGSGSPNTGINLNANGATVVTYKCNDQYRLNVSIADLTSATTTDTINATYVNVTGGNLINSSFAGAGVDQVIFGSKNTFVAAPDTGTSQTVNTIWRMTIPNVVSGTYTATVTYTLLQP